VLHVQAQKGWDQQAGAAVFEWEALTRPYGLQPGLTFQARLWGRLRSDTEAVASGLLVEVERYNAEPPKELPPDEQITRVVKTDPNGVATCTLPEAGWWALTAARGGGKKERDGQPRPVRERWTLWVFVDGK